MINTMLEEGKWNDEDCTVPSMYICEKSAVDSDKGMSKVCQSVAYKAQDILSPDCRRKKNRAHHQYKKNIAMTDCFQAGYSITRQSVVAIFFLYLWCARSFSACSPGLVYQLGTAEIVES